MLVLFDICHIVNNIMSLLLLHLIFVTLLLDDYVPPGVLKSTYRSSIMSIAIHIVLVIYDSFNQHHTCC